MAFDARQVEIARRNAELAKVEQQRLENERLEQLRCTIIMPVMRQDILKLTILIYLRW